MTPRPITAPNTTEIAKQLYAAQTALAEARTYLATQQEATAALTRVPVTPTALFTLIDQTVQDVVRIAVRMELADQPANTRELSPEHLAQLLSEADVHVNNGDYPLWGDLTEDDRDQYRQAARFLTARCSVSPRVPAAEGSSER
ncbi:hypothetical protein ACWERV_17165 [Streptomyces sp. NPDC004031]